MIKRQLNKFIISFLKLLITLSCILNLPYMTALIIKLSLKKYEIISSKKLSKKTLIIIEKSFGMEDLEESFINDLSNITFLILPRSIIRKIYNHFFGQFSKNQIRESSYETKDPLIINKKMEYRSYLISTIGYLNKLQDFRGFISFNLFFVSEREMQSACKELNIKFIVCHKECVSSKLLNNTRKYVWKNFIGKCDASAVSVYNEYTKDCMISSGVVNKEQITVTGMPRSDYYYKKNNLKKLKYKNFILFLMVERDAQLPNFQNYWYNSPEKKKFKFFTWRKNAIISNKIIIDFANSRPDLNFIFKTKPSTSEEEIKVFEKYNLSNCHLIKGGSSKELIKHCSFIIAFNTTGIFEAMIPNKRIIVPNFQCGKKEKKFLFNLDNDVVYLPKTKKEMILYLNLLSKIENKTNINKIKKKNTRLIKEHLANLDGKAGQRFRNFIHQNS